MFLKFLIIALAIYLLFKTFRKQIIGFITKAVFRQLEKEVQKRTQSTHFSHQSSGFSSQSSAKASSKEKEKPKKDNTFGEYVDFEEI